MTTVVKRANSDTHHTTCPNCGSDDTESLGVDQIQDGSADGWKDQEMFNCPHCQNTFEPLPKKPSEDALRRYEESKKRRYDNKKAVMAVSSPEQGKTCNCNQGDHSNANGDQHGMYNQEGGRANWQGQGLPQPSKTCECDEKPAEADKVPNADARISDKEMNKPKKKFLNYSDEEIVEVDGKTTKRKKKIKKMTPAQLEARKKKKPYRQDDLRRRKYREKKVRYISDLEEGGDGILREGKIGRNEALAHGLRVGQKRRKQRKERKIREGVEALDKKLKALEDIIKKRKTRRGRKGGRKGTIAGHTGRWRKTLTPLSGRGEPTTPKDNAATADNRAIAAKLGFLKQEPEKKINPKALGKPSKTAPPTGVKQFRKRKPKKIGNTTGSLTAAQGEADAANTKKQKEENERKAKESKKKKKGMSIFTKALLLAKYRGQKKETAAEKEKKKLEANLSSEVEANMKRVDDLKDNVDALGRDKRTQHSTSKIGDGKKGTLKLITPQRKKLQRELLANEKKQKEKEKKLLEEENKKKKIKPKVKPKKSKFPKFGIKGGGYDHNTIENDNRLRSHWKKMHEKHGLKMSDNFDIRTGTQQIGRHKGVPFDDLVASDNRRRGLRDYFRQHPHKRGETINYPPKGYKGLPTHQQGELSEDTKEELKAEENTHGAWGQRGLGDGNGTGAIQGAGDTHLISPVKQKELDKLMAGARYMPRSVKRRKN